MKTPKLIRKAREYMNPDKIKKKHRANNIKELLAKLKKKQRRLKERLEKEKDKKEKKHLETDIEVIQVQRKKGIKLLKKLKK